LKTEAEGFEPSIRLTTDLALDVTTVATARRRAFTSPVRVRVVSAGTGVTTE
jgi:hypothetical protein